MAKGKRANGEGTICQRQDGTWMVAVSLGRKPDGKVNRRCFYGKTRKEVQQKMVSCLNDSQRGIITIGTKQTVGAFMESWLEDVARPRIRETTYRSYGQITRNHIIPGIGKVQLNKLTPQQVQQFLKAVHDKGIHCEPVRRVLRAALNQALDWDLIARNPAKVKGIPKRDTKQGTYLDDEQARKLLEGCRNHKYGPLFTTTHTTTGAEISGRDGENSMSETDI